MLPSHIRLPCLWREAGFPHVIVQGFGEFAAGFSVKNELEERALLVIQNLFPASDIIKHFARSVTKQNIVVFIASVLEGVHGKSFPEQVEQAQEHDVAGLEGGIVRACVQLSFVHHALIVAGALRQVFCVCDLNLKVVHGVGSAYIHVHAYAMCARSRVDDTFS